MAANSMSVLLAGVEKESGVFKRNFEENRTIIEQGVKNDCLYRLKKGRVRFEKRIIENKVVQRVAVLGTMDDSSDWDLFCELSAFGIQENTSAAIVAETSVEVVVIPLVAFNDYLEKDAHAHAMFFEHITKRLAGVLRVLHTRQLNLSTLGLTKTGLQINGEAGIFSWSASMKGAVVSSEGHLVLSRNYVSFVKKKDADKKGYVSDAGDLAKTIIEVKRIQESSQQGSKLTLRDHKGKMTVTLKKNEKAEVALQVIMSAKSLLDRCLSPTRDLKATKLAKCSKCTKVFCSMCQCLDVKLNHCNKKEESHSYQGVNSSESLPRCVRCNNEGTHVLSLGDLKMLMSRFETKSYKPGKIIQSVGSKVDTVGYVLEGSVGVTVFDASDQPLQLKDVAPGETIGDIGVFNETPSSADLTSGKEGCVILEIPGSFLFDAKESEFRARVCFALCQLMWSRIIRHEESQVRIWSERMTSQESVMFLEESLLREGTGKGIDARGDAGWY